MLKKKNYTTLKMLTVAFLSSVIIGVAGSAGASDGYNLIDGQTINLTADTSISNTISTEATGRQTAILAAGKTAINTGDYILTANSNGSTQRNYIFNTTTSGTDFKFTGNLAAYATGVGTQEVRGLRQNATSSAIWDGNIRVSVTTENANAIGVDIWEGATATFQGDLTDISTDITGSGRYSYAIQNHTSKGSKVYLQAKQTNLTATGGVFAEAIAVHQGSVYLDGNANITAKNGSSGTRAINVESDAGNPYESLVSLKGELVTITASSNDSEPIGLYSSGSRSTISSEVDNLVITSKSTNDYATGILAQYGGKINFAKDKNVSINAEGNIAFGVCSQDSWGYSGKIVSHGNLTTTATGKANGYAVFVVNGSEFKANQLTAHGHATEQNGVGIGVFLSDTSNVSIGSTGKTSYLLGTADNGYGYGLYLQSNTTTTPTAVSLNGIMTVKGSSAGIENLGGNLTNNADLTVINGIYNEGVITFNEIVTFSGNYGNENAYDIYNNNTVTFNTGADTIVTISNGIGGDANNIGSNIVNINGAGMIDITGALNNQTVNVNNGILSLSNGTENGSNLSGSTVYVNNSGTISTLDNKINDYTSSIKLKDGAKIWADIQIGKTTSSVDKYGSFADNITVNLTGLKNLSDLSQLTSVGEQTIQLVDGNVKVDTTNLQYDFGYFTSGGRLVASNNVMNGSEIKADGTFKLSMDSTKGGLNNAVISTNEITEGGEDLVYVNYEMTGNESVSSLQTIKEAKFILNGNNNTITAQTGATGLKIDELSDVLISNTKFTGFDTSETNGVITNNGNLTIKDAEFRGGSGVALVNHGILYSDPTYYSQKVINASGGQITFDGDIFQNINTSAVDGAALYNKGEAVIKGCTFQDNKGQNGGAIYNTGTMTITDTSFTNNTATGLGGAIYNTGSLELIADRTGINFSGNTDSSNNAIYNTGNLTFNAKGTNINITEGISGNNGNIIFNAIDNNTITISSAITNNSLSFENGTVKLGNAADLSNATLLGGNGTLSFIDNSITASGIDLGTVKTDSNALNVAIDASLFEQTADLLKGTASSGTIRINEIKFTDNGTTTIPVVPVNIQIADTQNNLSNIVELGNTIVSTPTPYGNLLLTYTRSDGMLRAEASDLKTAIDMNASDKTYVVANGSENISVELGNLNDNTTKMTITGGDNKNPINGSGQAGITVANGKTLNINNTSMNNFSTAITNSGTLNINNVSFNNTKLTLQSGSVTTATDLTITASDLTITDDASLTATNPINLNSGTLDLVAQNKSTTLRADINGSYDVKVTSSAGNQVIIASAIRGATGINVENNSKLTITEAVTQSTGSTITMGSGSTLTLHNTQVSDMNVANTISGSNYIVNTKSEQDGSVIIASAISGATGINVEDNSKLTITEAVTQSTGSKITMGSGSTLTLHNTQVDGDMNVANRISGSNYVVNTESDQDCSIIIASNIVGANSVNINSGETIIDLDNGGNINNVKVNVADEAVVVFQSNNDYALNSNIVGQGQFNIGTEKGSAVGLSGNGTTRFSLNSIVSNATLGVAQGELILPNETNLINSNVAVTDNATLNTINGSVSTFHDTLFDDGVNVKLDADILAGTADNFDNANESGDIYLSMLNVSGAEKIVHNSASLNLGSATGLDKLTLASNYLDLGNVMTPIRRLHGFVSTTEEGLMLQYVPTGNSYKDFNPSVMASPVATQIGGYLTQLNSYDEAFRNMDMYMLMTKSQRRAMKLRNKFAAADGNLIFDPTMTSNEQKNAWFRPYSYFENVHLNRGPRVSNVSYGTFVGGDSELYELKNGWDAMWGSYVGYNGSHQAYSGNSIYQNGGTFGVVGMAYKDNFFTGLTVNVGASAGEASTMFGTDNFSMLMAGIASKTGYNFELKEGRFIIQPSLMLSYSFVNTFDYTNAAGVRMNSDPLHGISIEPGVKFIGNLPHGWQPYVGVSMVWNVMDRTQFHANDVSLPALSVDPYVKYGVGLRKTCGERFSGFLQAFLTNGGRNGVGLQIGFRWVLGKINTHPRIQSSVPTIKDTQITLKNLR